MIVEVRIQTHDGKGIAYRITTKSPWKVDIPSGEFEFRGSTDDLKEEVRKRESGSVTFSN